MSLFQQGVDLWTLGRSFQSQLFCHAVHSAPLPRVPLPTSLQEVFYVVLGYALSRLFGYEIELN